MRTRYPSHSHRLTVATAILLAAATAPGRSAPAGSKAPTPNGRIHYKVTSPMMSGTIVLSWIESGKRFRQDTKGSAGGAGKQQSFETWTISDGSHVHTHAPGMGKQVMRAKMPRSGGAGGLAGMTPFGGTHGGGPVIGKATILGKPCEIRKIGQGQGQGKVWLWKGLMMRMEMSGPQGGSMKMLATRLEESPKLSPALFKVPAGYQMKEFQMPAGQPGGAGPGPR